LRLKFLIELQPYFIGTLSQQALNPIELSYDPQHWKASSFNTKHLKHLGQYASSPGNDTIPH